MHYRTWLWMPLAAVSTSVYATTYLSVEQAQQAIFPGASMTAFPVTLTDEQVRHIEKLSNVNVRHKEIRAWKVSGGGWFIVDEVVGKHDFVTYAIGLAQDGSVKQIEVMEYRESYGYEIRNALWRNQFIGKTAANPLQLTQDIRNISGATLSCRHITDGVRRILITHDTAFR